jgi:Uncharacterized proteins of the AP superfamily
MQIKYPDYNRSLLSLSSSVLAHFGARAAHNTLSELDAELAKSYKNVVVMLFDGMGTAILERHLSSDAFLRRNLRTTISSVFPPTTTAATISIESGLSPAEHGWLGWSLYFNEVGANVSVFPNTISGSEGAAAADFHVARRFLPYASIIDKINAAGQARAYSVSPFSEYRSGSVREICDTVAQICSQTGKKYIYTYWHQPDYDMHDLGTSHPRITENIIQINAEVERLCKQLDDTLVIVTADHGLVDVEWRFLPEYPDITECLSRMPWIESRALAFAVKPGLECEFVQAFNYVFGDCYMLLSHKKVSESGLFGFGEPHPRFDGFLGDFIAVATSNIAIEVRERTDDVFRAAHAGLTADEMDVPFIVVR